MPRRFLASAAAAFIATGLHGATSPVTPRLVGDWWTVAGDPHIGPLTTPKQQPVDFGIWQAGDGTWQIWSCIRGTKEPGNTRLFHRWEGAKLTDRDWTPKGIALQADPALGETRGGLQAPFVLRHDGKYWMFYGDWANICLATSTDGKTFMRHRKTTRSSPRSQRTRTSCPGSRSCSPRRAATCRPSMRASRSSPRCNRTSARPRSYPDQFP